MSFNPYALPPLFSSVLFCALAFFVCTRRNRTVLNTTLGSACFVTSWWQVSWFFLFSVTTVHLVPILIKIGYSGIIFIPLTLYHFFVSFTKSKPDVKFVWVGYLLGVVLLAFLWRSSYFIDGFY